jgi:hypothetical protein
MAIGPYHSNIYEVTLLDCDRFAVQFAKQLDPIRSGGTYSAPSGDDHQ